jgi:gallate decarboxylase subunit D
VKNEIVKGQGRHEVHLQAVDMGNDLVVRIFNAAAHIGAVAVGEYDFEHQRASVSVIARLGHKDDAIAQKAAYLISKSSRKPVCVIAGVHLDEIKIEDIRDLQENAFQATEEFIKYLNIPG